MNKLVSPLSSESAERSALRERVKELDCLCSISRVGCRRGASLDDVLERIVTFIPPAWMHPDVAEARLIVEGVEYRTSNFRETEWRQAAEIIASGRSIGTLDVCYVERRPEQDEGPFLREERNLLNVISQRVGEIVERKQAELQLSEYRDQLRSLAQRITRTEDRERRRIARDLHDRVGQALSLAKIRLGVLLSRELPDDVATEISRIRELVGASIEDTRTLVFDISPPVLHEFGLTVALEWLAERLRDRYEMKVELRLSQAWEPVGEELRSALFVATREFLLNALRHAGPCVVTVDVCQKDGEVRLIVDDDGEGFDTSTVGPGDADKGGFGLFGVRERLQQFGGSLEVSSEPGRGTRIMVQVPYSVPRS